jgi:hypothetical protein
MPIVSMDAMRQALFRDAGANYGDIGYLSKPADRKFQTTTPNASSLYVYFNFNTKDGPLVLDFPAAVGAGLFGTLLDAWQMPLADVGPKGEDHGNGGKYLLLPSDFKGDVPASYIVVRSATYNGYALFRAIPTTSSDEDVSKAIALMKKQRLYPLASAASPPKQRFMDLAGKSFEGIFMAFAPQQKLGEASFYIISAHDNADKPLDGGNSYKLHILANVPARQFRAVTIYDTETAGFIRESPRVGVDSYDSKMKKNADGSVDVYFGPKARPGQETNWVPTTPGRQWFAMFRFYGPDKPLFEKTWKLTDIELSR